MKFTIFLLLFPTLIWGQTKIFGIVYANNQTQENVTITNLDTKQSVVSNRLGKFVIQASINDSLKFEQIGFFNRTIAVNAKQIQIQEISLELKPEVIQLKEITVDASKKINALSLGIIQKPAKKYNQTERRLETAGDFKPIHLLALLGGNLPIDPIINKITGRTNMLKKNLAQEKQNILFEKLKETYDTYLIEVIKVEDESKRNLFFNFLTEIENIENYVFTNNLEQNNFYIYEKYTNDFQNL